MKSLKLKKVKISKVGNPHILFGGATTITETQVDVCPNNGTLSYELRCKTKDPKDTDCDTATVTNTLTTNRTDPNGETHGCGLGGYSLKKHIYNLKVFSSILRTFLLINNSEI